MKDDSNPDVFMSEIYQLRDKPSDFDEVATAKRITAIILDALSANKYFTIKIQATRNPG